MASKAGGVAQGGAAAVANQPVQNQSETNKKINLILYLRIFAEGGKTEAFQRCFEQIKADDLVDYLKPQESKPSLILMATVKNSVEIVKIIFNRMGLQEMPGEIEACYVAIELFGMQEMGQIWAERRIRQESARYLATKKF